MTMTCLSVYCSLLCSVKIYNLSYFLLFLFCEKTNFPMHVTFMLVKWCRIKVTTAVGFCDFRDWSLLHVFRRLWCKCQSWVEVSEHEGLTGLCGFRWQNNRWVWHTDLSVFFLPGENFCGCSQVFVINVVFFFLLRSIFQQTDEVRQ